MIPITHSSGDSTVSHEQHALPSDKPFLFTILHIFQESHTDLITSRSLAIEIYHDSNIEAVFDYIPLLDLLVEFKHAARTLEASLCFLFSLMAKGQNFHQAE